MAAGSHTHMLKDSTLLSFSRAVVIVLGIVKTVIITRCFSTAEVGLFYLAMGTALFFSEFVMPQFEEAASRFIAEKRATDHDKAARILSAAILVVAACSLLVFLAARFPLEGAAMRFYSKPGLETYYRMFLLMIFLEPLNTVLAEALKITTRFAYFAVSNIARSCADVIMVLAFFRAGFGLEGAIAAFILSAALQAAISYFGIRDYIRMKDLKSLLSIDKEILRFWYPLCGSALLKAGISKMPTIVGGRYLSLDVLAYFEIAYRAVLNVFSVFRQYILVAHSHLMNIYYSERAKFEDMFSRAVRRYALFVVPSAAVMVVASPFLFTLLYGEAYAKAAPVFSVLVITEIFSSVSAFAKTIFYVKDRTGLYLAFHGLNFTIQLVLIVPLAMYLGVMGLAAATAASAAIFMLANYTAVKRMGSYAAAV